MARYSRSYKRSRKRQKRSRSSYLRRRRRRRRKYTPMQMQVIPKQLIKKFRYCDDVSINASTGQVAAHVFRANNMRAPDVTGTTTSHQPYGFDQYVGPMYNFYTVLGAKISCTFSCGQPGDTVENNIICGVQLKDDAAVTTDPQLIRERGLTRWLSLTNQNTSKKMSKKFSAKRFFNVADMKDNDQFSGSQDTGPIRQAYFHVWAASCAPNINPRNVLVNVIIEYIVALQEPDQFNVSI